MTDKIVINNWQGGSTLQTWKDGDWQIVYAKDSAGNCVTLSLNSSDAVRLAYAVSSQPGEQFDRMREYMHAVYELSYPEARSDELRQIANEIECGSRCERCPADQPERGEYCGFVAADSLRKLAAALDAKAKADAEASTPADNAVFLARRNIYQQCAKIADDLRDQYPDVADNGGTRDGWEMACEEIAESIRTKTLSTTAPQPDTSASVGAMREALERLVAIAEKQKSYFFVEQSRYPCVEDYIDDDGMLTLPDEISPLLSHVNANGRYSEADWWLSTLRSMLAAANQSDGGVRTAPASCPNCFNEDDCANVDICNAVADVYSPSEAPPDWKQDQAETTRLPTPQAVEAVSVDGLADFIYDSGFMVVGGENDDEEAGLARALLAKFKMEGR